MTERKAGNSRLVYNKATRTIDTVQSHECGPGGETYEPPVLGVPPNVIDAMAHALWEEVGVIEMERARRVIERSLVVAANEGFVMAHMPRKAKTISSN